MKTKLALATALAAALMLVLFLVGCGSTTQTHPRTVKDVDLTKYADLEVGNLVVILPDGTEKKYDVSTDFWAEQVEDNVWFYDEYKYALVIEKDVVVNIANESGKAKHDMTIVLNRTQGADVAGTRVSVDGDTAVKFHRGVTVIACGNICDVPNDLPELTRNTQVLAV